MSNPTNYQCFLMGKRFAVDPDRGLIARVEYLAGPHGWQPAGSLVGNIRSDNGACFVGVAGSRFPTAHVVWFLTHKQWPDRKVGHINGDPTDCRPSNLRMVSHRDTTRAARKPNPKAQARSGYRGLQQSSSGKWTATVRVGDVDPEVRRAKAVNLGSFTSTHGAALMWNFAAHRAGYLNEALNDVPECYAEEAIAAVIERVEALRPNTHTFTAATCSEFSRLLQGEWEDLTPQQIVASINRP